MRKNKNKTEPKEFCYKHILYTDFALIFVTLNIKGHKDAIHIYYSQNKQSDATKRAAVIIYNIKLFLGLLLYRPIFSFSNLRLLHFVNPSPQFHPDKPSSGTIFRNILRLNFTYRRSDNSSQSCRNQNIRVRRSKNGGGHEGDSLPPQPPCLPRNASIHCQRFRSKKTGTKIRSLLLIAGNFGGHGINNKYAEHDEVTRAIFKASRKTELVSIDNLPPPLSPFRPSVVTRPRKLHRERELEEEDG